MVGKLFHARDASHVEHWKTDSYVRHKALRHYYEDAVEMLDEFIEAYQGTFGIINDVVEQEKDVAKLIHDDIIWLNENRSRLAKGVLALENILDEITALHMKTLYKL